MSKLEHYLLNLTLQIQKDVSAFSLRFIDLLGYFFSFWLIFTRMGAFESVCLTYPTGCGKCGGNSSFTRVDAFQDLSGWTLDRLTAITATAIPEQRLLWFGMAFDPCWVKSR